MLLHINPTRQRGKCTGFLARASGWYMTFFAAGVILQRWIGAPDWLTSSKIHILQCPALRLRFRLVASDLPGIVCILDSDRSGAVELAASE